MKKEYEKPLLEVFSFDVTDRVMDSDGCSEGYSGAVCPLDGTCNLVDICVWDGIEGSGI